MAAELKKTLAHVRGGRLRERPWYRALPDELLQLRHVALSGDGEPTLSPRFAEALQAVVHVRALSGFPFFKLVLMTNATGLDQPEVQQGLKHFTRSDEVWAKLDGGTQAYVNKVNRPSVPLEKILSNILMLGRQRPVVIQSLFPAIKGEEPPLEEIEQYARRLLELKKGGAQISLVQIYSATRPSLNSESGHLPLKVLSRIAQTVRQTAGVDRRSVLAFRGLLGLVVQPVFLQYPDLLAQLGVAQRLDDARLDVHGVGQLGFAGQLRGTEHHHRQLARDFGVLMQPAEDFQPVLDGHLQVQQEQRREGIGGRSANCPSPARYWIASSPLPTACTGLGALFS